MDSELSKGVDGGQSADRTDPVRIKCAADPTRDDLDVQWTRGAIFEFGSSVAIDEWLVDQNAMVPGRLFLSRVPCNGGALSVDYYLKYTSRSG